MKLTIATGAGRFAWRLSPDPWALIPLAMALYLALWGALLLRKLLWETGPG